MSSSYREYRPPAGLESMVACLWEHEATGEHRQRVVPDGCVDLIWLAERELTIAGADTGPREVALPSGSRTCGIRLRPGTAGALLGFPASEIRDRGGADGEAMRPLDFSPEPGRPLRALLAEDVIADALDVLAAEQDRDGGWDVDFTVYSPAAALEWRGEATVRVLRALLVNGRLGAHTRTHRGGIR